MTIQSMYVQLYCSLAQRGDLSRRRVAHDSGVHHSKVIRILDHGADARFEVLANIGKAVGADPIRALIAVFVLEDPEAYHSPIVRVAAELLTMLVEQLREMDEGMFEGFINQEFTSIITMVVKTMRSAIERRDRRLTFI